MATVLRRQGQGRDARLRRHSFALRELAQRLWQSGDGLQTALSAITETAAIVLLVDRVNVWQFDAAGGLRCVHSYERERNLHNPPGFDAQLPLGTLASSQALSRVRVVPSFDPQSEAVSGDPLATYLYLHGIRSLIDAPVRVGAELYGVICHELMDSAREWRRDEIAFAGNMGDFVALALEAERRRRAEARLEFLELHDPVTGLANRPLFHVAMKDLLHRQRKRPRLAALLFVSVDRFTSVNESVGETGGDAALIELGDRINAATPDEAIIARVESDCFTVLLPRIAQEWQAVQIAESILEALVVPLRIGQRDITVSASIGIAFNQGDVATTSDILLRDADLASKQAKQLGRNRCEIFDPEQHRGLLDRLQIEYGLREALRNDDLVVVYQPEFDLKDGRVVAAEALLRWRQADGSLRTAGGFIDVAETSGQIVKIGRWVLQRACNDATRWPLLPDGRACTLAVNLSARQFEQPGLVAMVTEVLRESGLAPQRLCLEITETTLMTRAQSALDTLHALKALGVSLAIDDFGTGYSSLAYLQRFPVDTLKIDKSLIDSLPEDPHAHAIVWAVVGLAGALEMEVVVEGVEHLAQEHALRTMGCRRVQGWLYAHGEPDDVFVARLGAQRLGAKG
jgi:diguanylate cyclase (GGDEF)-like protein